MSLSYIPNNLKTDQYNDWNLDDDLIKDYESDLTYQDNLNKVILDSEYLKNLSISEILNFFDNLVIYWLSKDNNFINSFSHLGVSFLLNFMRKSNLKKLISESLHGNIDYLDDFVFCSSLNKKMIANPRGVITHWLAGNVPVLGMISILQGIVTKNTNIIKLPKENGLVLPFMVSHIREYSFVTKGKTISGKDIMKSCMFVYCDRNDKTSQESLSIKSDIRVAWGGRNAVESVMSLPRKYGTDDVIFGPKYSFAAIARNSFNPDDLIELTYKLAMDASIFEQQGCNSPHTVFVEQGGDITPEKFAEALSLGMGEVLKRIPKNSINSSDAYKIVNLRSEYSFTGKVFSSKGTEWTVILSNEKGLADACYQRTIFIRPVEEINAILPYIEKNKHQTLGLVMNDERTHSFIKQVTSRGIERITEIGKMSFYNYPWDGIFPMSHYVKWSSSEIY